MRITFGEETGLSEVDIYERVGGFSPPFKVGSPTTYGHKVFFLIRAGDNCIVADGFCGKDKLESIDLVLTLVKAKYG